MSAAGFEPAIPAVEQLQTFALDGTATGIGQNVNNKIKFVVANSDTKNTKA
jgi:hypothetical protein